MKKTGGPFGYLSKPAQRALANAGVKDLKGLLEFTESALKQLHGIGPNALKKLKAEMEADGVWFKEEAS